LKALYKQNNKAGDYVDRILYKYWTQYAFLYPQYSQDTSNIIELLNGTWSDIRNLQPLKLINAIYTTVIKTFYNRFHCLYQSQDLPNAQLQAFNKQLQHLQQYQIYQLGNSIYQVEHPDTGVKYIINLTQKTCKCTNFQEYKSLYIHRIAACKYVSLDPFKKFSKYHKLWVYRETYSWFLQPVSIQDLESDLNIHPPIIRKQRGRPKSKHMQKGADKRKYKTCSNCGKRLVMIRELVGVNQFKMDRDRELETVKYTHHQSQYHQYTTDKAKEVDEVQKAKKLSKIHCRIHCQMAQ
jgi:hypothetical protein